jgi:hypothetical protein
MRVAEKVDLKGLKIKKSVGNRKNHNVGRSDVGSERINLYVVLFHYFIIFLMSECR